MKNESEVLSATSKPSYIRSNSGFGKSTLFEIR
jgi:hypothetical protein